MSAPRIISLSRRIFALLLLAYPREFRRRFGDDMRELFEDQLRASLATSGARGVAALWLRTTPRLIGAAALEMADAMRASVQIARHARFQRGLHAGSTPYRGDRMLAAVTTDLRFAFRMLRKSPVFAFVSIFCIALGSGAASTIFSAMNALLLRPLPGAVDGRALVRVERKAIGGDDGVSASYPLYQRLTERSRTLEGIAAWGKASLTVRVGDGDGVSVYGSFVSGNLFPLLGVRPMLGRFFAAEESRTELTHPVVVVSEHFWRTRLSADKGAVGREVTMNGHPYTVIGVAPAAFEGLDAPVRTDVWVPLMMQSQIRLNSGPLASSQATWLRMFGRLADGVSVDAAHRELAAITTEFANEGVEPKDYRRFTDIQLSPLTGLPPDATRPLTMFLALLLGAATLVLLIASVNVASMLGARAIARRREMAVRAALGASRGRLVRQLLTEVLVLFVLGALGGMWLAELATRGLESIAIPGTLPIMLELSPDWRVLAFSLGVSLACGIAFGLAPALQAASRDVASRMRSDSSGGGSRRSLVGSSLVVAQLALSLLLLVGAGLFLRALHRGARIDPGFDSSGVATMALDTESWGYDDAKGRAFYRELRDRVATLPGVASVTYSVFLPLTLHSNGTSVTIGNAEGRDGTGGVPVSLLAVDADYFGTLRMPLVAGRAIASTDDERAPKVVVVNETFARRYLAGRSALGETIGYDGQRITIVGIARDAKYSTLSEDTPAFVYFPIEQRWEPKHVLIARTRTENPLTLAPALAAAVRSIAPNAARPVVTTLRNENTSVLLPQRFAAIVTASLGAVGLVLAIVGLYGVVSYSASRRSREIGIRLALGARAAQVQRMIVREGMRLTLVGVAIGLILATGVTRLLVRFLFGISPLDGMTFVAMSAAFIGVAALASWVPARRASEVEPMVVLRGE